MKAIQSTLFLVLLSMFLFSCGGENNTTENSETENATENTETTSSGEETGSTTSSSNTTSGSLVADAVVQQACDCQEGARQEDGTIDFPKMGECMGGKNKIQFVADMLGADATEKQRADAEMELTEKMNSKCPR